MKRLLPATAGVFALVSSDGPAEGACPTGQYFNVPLSTCATCCSGGPDFGCRSYECSTGALVGWSGGPCPTVSSCASSCGTPSAECYELCENARDDDGDGVADDGCDTSPDSACTIPGGCRAQDGASVTTGNITLVEPSDWSLFRAGPVLEFTRVYRSQWYRPYGTPIAPGTAAGFGWSHTFMANVASLGGTPAKAIVTTEDGREILFTDSGALGACASGTQFTPSPGHYFKYLCKLSNNTWSLRELSGRRLWFDTSGRLANILAKEDSNADGGADDPTRHLRVTVSYNASSFPTQAIVDVAGTTTDTLAFGYDVNNKLTSTTYSGKSVGYTYGQSGSSAGRLTKATYPDGKFRTYAYNSEGFLSTVTDETGKVIRTIAYVSGQFGKVRYEATPDGEVAFRYAGDPAPTSVCGAGNTEVLWNKMASPASCTADANCSGGFCAAGVCWSAHACDAWSQPSEQLVKDVTNACATCASISHWEWFTNATTVELRGVLGATSVGGTKTSYQRDSATGVVLTSISNDNDYDASNGTTNSPAQTAFYAYSATWPSLPTTIATASVLNSGCTGTGDTNCHRVTLGYDANGNPSSIADAGWMRNSTDTQSITYTYTTSMTWNNQGQVTQVDGPRPISDVDDTVNYVYYAAADAANDRFRLKEVKRTVASAGGGYLSTQYFSYDIWGNATRVVETDGSGTSPRTVCRTFDANRGWLLTERRVVNGLSDCSSVGTSDETVTYTHDDAGRVTQVARPKGNCMSYLFDSAGRPRLTFSPSGREIPDVVVSIPSSRRPILVVEDVGIVARTISGTFERFWPVRIASSIAAARMELQKSERFAAAVIDPGLPDGSGLALVELVHQHSPAAAVLIVTGSLDHDLVNHVQRLGAEYVCKPDFHGGLIVFARRLVAAEHLADAKMRLFLERYAEKHHLSPRLTEIVSLAMAGLSREEIAAKLRVTVNTVKSYAAEIVARCDEESLPELASFLVAETRKDGGLPTMQR